MTYFWKEITSNTRGVGKDVVNVHNELAILAKREKELSQEGWKIRDRWDFISRSCKHNSDGWSDEELTKHCIGLAGPCQHPENPQPAQIGNCGPEYCPLEIGGVGI